MHSIGFSRIARGILVAFAVVAAAPGADAQSAPAGDITGLTPGMTYAEIVAALEAREDLGLVETAEQWVRQSNGVPTRQLVRAVDGVDCDTGEKFRKVGWGSECETLKGRLTPRKAIGQEIVVAFLGMPGKEVAGQIWRRVVFAEGENPSISGLEEALVEKYGAPHVRQTESGYYSTKHRFGATLLSWIYGPDGNRITEPDRLKATCVNGPQPWFTGGHSWNGGCGLTIRAEILPVKGNNLLAQELNVTVLDQQALLVALRQFDADLKAAVAAGAGKKKKPTL
ncbi:hypothetical protein [Oceanibacterium hippocampi]|uniref:Uncharacterized protein n=1 Tax=Oceanibacterium hippocampi TaxID=745714 RepID=A0A1Y5S8J5_9PROT|nr:hypothetical protein [Oceanibacterium hippocampi]SLN34785.1 hypothetical protein OCH7691_01363 [Oceanibacterium hippocampi]